MSAESDSTVIRELTKVVHSMQNKVISLEKTVLEQSELIKTLIQNHETDGDLTKSARKIVEANAKDDIVLSAKQPMRMRSARARAVAKLSMDTRNKKGGAPTRNVTPAVPVARAEKPSTPSRSAPCTPTVSIPPSVTSSMPVLSLQVPAINVPVQANDIVAQQANNDEWVEVSRRVRRSPTNVTRGTAAPGSVACTLAAAERKSYLHLYYVKIGTTTEEVLAHLHTICSSDKCTAEALRSRGDYASFKLVVPTKNVELYMKPEHWAEDVCIKPWRSGFRNSLQQAR